MEWTGLPSFVSLVMFSWLWLDHVLDANPDARRLYDDLLRKNKYNRLIRPIGNSSEKLYILVSLKLSQIIDVDEKNEIITTNVWLNQEWTDSSLVWNPLEYGNVDMLYVPAESIWIPDLVLYNNADGDYIITLMTKATITYNGSVKWEPPAIYKSQCDIGVTYFPFDEQNCTLKFGIWTYGGDQIDIRHKRKPNEESELDYIHKAIQLDEYYKSVEWDLMNVTAQKHIVLYPCCGTQPYPDITFHIIIRRKTLYLVINLIIPCVSINMLSLLAFYLPCDCGEKVSVCLTIMLSLSLFQLLLMELVPGTSIVIPMIGKYLLFTCILVSMSVIASIVVLNINHRSSSTHEMPRWVHVLFLERLPRLLFIERPPERASNEMTDIDFSKAQSELLPFENPYKKHFRPTAQASLDLYAGLGDGFAADGRSMDFGNICDACSKRRLKRFPPNVHKAIDGIAFIANHIKSADDGRRAKDDWKYVARVVDRILLIVYISVCFFGAMGILLYAPSLYDGKQPLPDGI